MTKKEFYLQKALGTLKVKFHISRPTTIIVVTLNTQKFFIPSKNLLDRWSVFKSDWESIAIEYIENHYIKTNNYR